MVSSDARRFEIRHLFLLMTTMAIGLGAARAIPGLGWSILACIVAFWCGRGILIIADLIDDRPIDERNLVSATFSVIGALTCFFSIVVGAAYLIVVVGVWIGDGF